MGSAASYYPRSEGKLVDVWTDGDCIQFENKSDKELMLKSFRVQRIKPNKTYQAPVIIKAKETYKRNLTAAESASVLDDDQNDPFPISYEFYLRSNEDAAAKKEQAEKHVISYSKGKYVGPPGWKYRAPDLVCEVPWHAEFLKDEPNEPEDKRARTTNWAKSEPEFSAVKSINASQSAEDVKIEFAAKSVSTALSLAIKLSYGLDETDSENKLYAQINNESNKQSIEEVWINEELMTLVAVKLEKKLTRARVKVGLNVVDGFKIATQGHINYVQALNKEGFESLTRLSTRKAGDVLTYISTTS